MVTFVLCRRSLSCFSSLILFLCSRAFANLCSKVFRDSLEDFWLEKANFSDNSLFLSKTNNKSHN